MPARGRGSASRRSDLPAAHRRAGRRPARPDSPVHLPSTGRGIREPVRNASTDGPRTAVHRPRCRRRRGRRVKVPAGPTHRHCRDVTTTGDCPTIRPHGWLNPVTTPESEIPATRESTDLPLRLAAVDDHPYVLKGILWTLRELAPWITVITTAGSVAEMLDNGGAAADVVLLDLDLGVPQADEESDPAHNVHTILQAGPQVLILTAEVRPVPVRRAVAAGAVGLVLKSDPESQLIQAIRTARTGELAVSSRLAHALLTDPTLVGHLAPRERQVFELLAQGVGRYDIGKLLEPPAATSTVDTYLKRAANTYRSLGRPTYNAYETLQHVIQDGHVGRPHPPPSPTGRNPVESHSRRDTEIAADDS